MNQQQFEKLAKQCLRNATGRRDPARAFWHKLFSEIAEEINASIYSGKYKAHVLSSEEVCGFEMCRKPAKQIRSRRVSMWPLSGGCVANDPPESAKPDFLMRTFAIRENGLFQSLVLQAYQNKPNGFFKSPRDGKWEHIAILPYVRPQPSENFFFMTYGPLSRHLPMLFEAQLKKRANLSHKERIRRDAQALAL